MADQEKKPGADEASTQAARTAERARIQGIQSCEEAKGREALANHLALNTEMSVDDAKAILAASPKVESKTEAAAQTQQTQGNAFKATMDADNHPNVGADGAGGEAASGEQSAAARILANYRLATGRNTDLAGAKK